MLFAIMVMYAMHHFAHYNYNDKEALDASRLKDDRDNCVDNINFTLMFQRRNSMADSERGRKVGPPGGQGYGPASY